MILQNNLRKARINQHKTLLDLSIMTAISQSDLSQIELGRRPAYPKWRRKLSEALNISENELFPSAQRMV